MLVASCVFFSSCSGTKQQNKVDQKHSKIFENAFRELNKEIDMDGMPTDYFDQNEAENKWQPFLREEIFNPNFETYRDLVGRLNKQCMKDISETIKISIQSVYKEDTQASDDDYTTLITNFIQSQTNATFTGNDIKPGKYKTEKDLKALDTLSYTLYFNKDNYYNRIENEKQENESDAVNYLTQARDSFVTGNLVECLSKMSLCHYSIFKGGLQARYTDKNGNEMKVVDDLNSLKREIASRLSVEILDKEDLVNEDWKIDFKKGDPRKILKLRIGWDGRNKIRLDEIEVKLVETEKGNILGNDYTNEGGIAHLDIKDQLSEHIEELKGYIKVKMVPPGIFDQFYVNSEPFKEFENGILRKMVEITNYSFPLLKIAIITESKGNIDALDRGVLNALSEYGQPFFKINDLDETDKTVWKNHLNKKKFGRVFDINKYKGYIDGILKVKYTSATYSDIKISFYTLKDLENNKALFTYVYQGSATGMITAIEAEIAMTKFLHNHFYRDIELQLNPMVHPSTVKAKDFYETQSYESEANDKNIFLEKQSRYHNLRYEVDAPGYEPKLVEIPAQSFNFKQGPRPNPTTHREPVPLKKKVGNLNIDIIPDVEYPDKFNNGKVQVTIRKKKWYVLNESEKVLSGKKNFLFSTDKFGKYLISVKHDGFDSPPPKLRDIQYGLNKKIVFGLKYKSPIKSQVMSAILPGWGHKYMDRPLLESIIPITVSSLFRLGYVSSGGSYITHRKQFKTSQNLWISSTTPEETDTYKEKSKNEWNQMKSAQSQFIGTFASAIITNIITGIWLWRKTA